eukprot:m.117666 g.117666  ORF g.117666 m.117666 type:complete len:931 (+) comp13203_c0_seq2:57-2849(+)
MGTPTPNSLDDRRVPWLPTDGSPSSKVMFFMMLGFFLAVLLGVAYVSYTKQRDLPDNQLYRWHFLGGKKYNHILGFFSLFSTIFSAVTIAGVPFEASAAGFFALRWLTSGIWVGIGAICFVPRLYRLSGLREYDAPGDVVADRFNNRALSAFTTLIAACSVFLYLIIQFYAISDLLPALSRVTDGGNVLDRNGTTWVLAIIILLSEWLGGFDAVTQTDMLQSVVLIFAFVCIPSTYAYYYGSLAGAADSFGYDCENYFVINCTQQAFIDFGSPCASSSTAAAFQTGCLAYSANYLQLYPAGTEASQYFKPLTEVAETGCNYNYNHSLPTCTPTVLEQIGWWAAVPPAQWGAAASTFPKTYQPYSENRAWADKQFNSPLPTYLGVDGSGTFSRTAFSMFSFNLLFFALSLFPHWIMKWMSIKSDHEVRFAFTTLTWATLWATFPMVIVGISGGALLKGIYPDAGSEFFAVIIDNMANKGGFTEFLAAMGATGAIAAMMSTVDSALLSVTNSLSTEFLRNWLMPNAEDKTLLRICKVISAVSVVATLCIALYDKKLQDDPNVYSTLIAWQSSLLWQILPATLISLYVDVNGWACLIGQICGIATIIGLYLQQDSCHHWNTDYAWRKDSYKYEHLLSAQNHPDECDVGTYYLDYHVWAAVVNVGVTIILSIPLSIMGVGSTFTSLEMPHVNERFGSKGGHLSIEKVREIMGEAGTREPIKDPAALFCILAAVLLTTLSLPWYGDAFDDCDYDSYVRWQACEIADVDCKAMCDQADMTLAPPLAAPALMQAASACLNNASMTCSCPLQGGYFTLSSAGIMVPTHEVANVSYSETLASLTSGGGIVFQGSGNGKICEGYNLTGGIPNWAIVIISCWIVSMFFMTYAWLRWSCVDDPNQTQARGSVTSADLKAQEFQGHEMGPTETILNITATSVV